MKRQWLKRAILSMVACGSLAGFIPGVQAADVRILPVDNAKFLAGAKFDFDVEVSKAKNLKNVDITVNGQKADKFFGQELKGKDLGNDGRTGQQTAPGPVPSGDDERLYRSGNAQEPGSPR